jgi:hypothetical protein
MMRRTTALAIPLEKVVFGDVFGQWIELLRRTAWPGPVFRFRPAYIVPARNGLTAKALLRGDWDDFLFIDSDIAPEVNLPERIAELTAMPAYLAADGGVVCGAYYQREYPFETQLYNPHPEMEGLQFIHPARWLRALEDAATARHAGQGAPVLEVGGGGTGLMLIRRDVLERMAAFKGADAIWETPAIEPKLLERVRAAGEDRANGVWTEDVWFCIEVRRRLGIRVMADTDLRFTGGHAGIDLKGPRDYIAAHTLPKGYEDAKPTLPFGYEVEQPNRAARRRIAAGRG